ncbi:glutaredoxin-1 [Fomitiporia mediterranea MF3/22]|uniref:glutaredoxin-1 n=1 Tax=Fomitiporia mediterranea (strain MF3/22) TaxID=694068 RepID=UPI0004407489|nr:glutaredoxin-1 [Fomitiporia mediterranea MF3/22]EJC98639.1 glutaredoxin-1 [Fomitiporia mediterranea MF3/22]
MSEDQRAALTSLVDNMIESNRIAVFSKSYCPYCRRAKQLLADKYNDVPAFVIELDERPDGGDIQDYLREKTGQGTVPNIFIDTKHIGGSSDLIDLEDKKQLEPLIHKM